MKNTNIDFKKLDFSPVTKIDNGISKKINIIGKIDLPFSLLFIKYVDDA